LDFFLFFSWSLFFLRLFLSKVVQEELLSSTLFLFPTDPIPVGSARSCLSVPAPAKGGERETWAIEGGAQSCSKKKKKKDYN